MLISVTGMVGAGKTTVAQLLADRLGFAFAHERVEANENRFLEPYYADGAASMKKYQFPLALHYLACRVNDLAEMKAVGGDYITDQHLGVDTDVFMQAHLQARRISREEYDLARQIYYLFGRIDLAHPDVLVYLDAPVDFLISRIIQRNRAREVDAPVSHWMHLHALLTSYMTELEARKNIPVIRINMLEQDFVRNPQLINRVIAAMVDKGLLPDYAVTRPDLYRAMQGV